MQNEIRREVGEPVPAFQNAIVGGIFLEVQRIGKGEAVKFAQHGDQRFLRDDQSTVVILEEWFFGYVEGQLQKLGTDGGFIQHVAIKLFPRSFGVVACFLVIASFAIIFFHLHTLHVTSSLPIGDLHPSLKNLVDHTTFTSLPAVGVGIFVFPPNPEMEIVKQPRQKFGRFRLPSDPEPFLRRDAHRLQEFVRIDGAFEPFVGPDFAQHLTETERQMGVLGGIVGFGR
mmetsp:Transcript_48438/g.58444  ORF Transcript_48438/g.58444 Transcript_48438/m.58444 type:complete len:228 (-) Transcript_48438:498-1181(-)